MRAGVIVEGNTDAAVLEALVQSKCPEVLVTVLQPKRDRTTGWPGLKEYLNKKGRDLEKLSNYGGYCGILVQADADIAGLPCSPQGAAYQWKQAESRLLAWSELASWPRCIYPVIPVMCLETWSCASHVGCRNRTPQMECFSCERVVSNLRDDNMREAVRRKETSFYREKFAPAVVENWEQVVRFCPVGAGKFDMVLRQLRSECCAKEEV